MPVKTNFCRSKKRKSLINAEIEFKQIGDYARKEVSIFSGSENTQTNILDETAKENASLYFREWLDSVKFDFSNHSFNLLISVSAS